MSRLQGKAEASDTSRLQPRQRISQKPIGGKATDTSLTRLFSRRAPSMMERLTSALTSYDYKVSLRGFGNRRVRSDLVQRQVLWNASLLQRCRPDRVISKSTTLLCTVSRLVLWSSIVRKKRNQMSRHRCTVVFEMLVGTCRVALNVRPSYE